MFHLLLIASLVPCYSLPVVSFLTESRSDAVMQHACSERRSSHKGLKKIQKKFTEKKAPVAARGSPWQKHDWMLWNNIFYHQEYAINLKRHQPPVVTTETREIISTDHFHAERRVDVYPACQPKINSQNMLPTPRGLYWYQTAGCALFIGQESNSETMRALIEQ